MKNGGRVTCLTTERPLRPARDIPPAAFRDTSAQDRNLRSPTFWHRHRVALSAAAALVVAAGSLLPTLKRVAGARASFAASGLTIDTVQRGEFVRDFAADGKVVAAGSPMLYSPSAGTVVLHVKPGDAVTRGQVLADIDSPDLAARLSQERATLQSLQFDLRRARLEAAHAEADAAEALDQAKVDHAAAQREFDRSFKAYEAGAYAEMQMRRAEDDLGKAKFHLDRTERTLVMQRAQSQSEVQSRESLVRRQQLMVDDLVRQVGELQLRSSTDGQVGQLRVDDRASVQRDAPLLTLIDLSRLEVEIQAPESFARDLAPGMSAELSGNDTHWAGTVSAVSPEVVDGQVAARVRFAEDKPTGLRQNQHLSVRVLIENRKNVLTVERGSFFDRGGDYLYRVDNDLATRTPVRLGAASISRVEVLQGLKPGDRVVVFGAEAFEDAERVILSR